MRKTSEQGDVTADILLFSCWKRRVKPVLCFNSQVKCDVLWFLYNYVLEVYVHYYFRKKYNHLFVVAFDIILFYSDTLNEFRLS
jgi:predicted adenine nucleotide alpha hydrolase (AANH) superfamily ATPase